MKGAVDLSERWEAERLEDYRRLKAGAQVAARSYNARRYRRGLRWVRRNREDLLFIAGVAVWFALVWLAGGWLLRGGA